MPSRLEDGFPRIEDPPGHWRDAFLAFATEPFCDDHDKPDHEPIVKRLLPASRRFGMTRLADITGFDRLGLPVVQAIRPAALSEVTALGRGNTLAQAAIGAIMESCERYFAEAVPAQRVSSATADELALASGLFEGYLRPDHADDWRSRPLPWIMGVEIPSGGPAPIPLELVHTRYTDPPPAGDGVFTRSTTGLACHFSASRALLHGLFECIERDALARAFQTHGFFDRFRVKPPMGGKTAKLMQAARDTGIAVAFWRAPSPTGLPVVWCQAIESAPTHPILALPTEGYSARQTIDDACAEALREALVTRAAAISGARDDQTAAHYKAGHYTDALAKARDLILNGEPSAQLPASAFMSPANLSELLDLVASSGLGPILAVPVGLDREAGVLCVRVVLGRAHAFCVVR